VTLTREMVELVDAPAVANAGGGSGGGGGGGGGGSGSGAGAGPRRSVVPHVIEPSFGIGRILTALLEHSFYVRDGGDGGEAGAGGAGGAGGELARSVLALPPRLAPWKCAVLPLDGRVAPALAQGVFEGLRALGLSASLDAGGASIGKRYARADELGTPFAVTVDFESAADSCATVRERDSTRQVRLPIADVPATIRALCEGSLSWAEVEAKAAARVN